MKKAKKTPKAVADKSPTSEEGEVDNTETQEQQEDQQNDKRERQERLPYPEPILLFQNTLWPEEILHSGH